MLVPQSTSTQSTQQPYFQCRLSNENVQPLHSEA